MIGLRRLWFRLTGRCPRYLPDKTGLCCVCRIPGAAGLSDLRRR